MPRIGYIYTAIRFTRRSSIALMATTIVLTDITAAPIAGDSTNPIGARTPSANHLGVFAQPISEVADAP